MHIISYFYNPLQPEKGTDLDHQNRIDQICSILKATYPKIKTQLHHKNPFELLIATILSAQCTDRQVNGVTGHLFTAFPTPSKLATASLKSIEAIIHSTGFYHNKARHIKNCARALVDHHNAAVPCTLPELIRLPGVGRKTANVVLGAAFGIPGIVVDTHVARISRRLGLTQNQNPEKIEFDLMRIIPEKEWNDFGLRLIYFGREFCRAKKPVCPACPLTTVCPFPEKVS